MKIKATTDLVAVIAVVLWLAGQTARAQMIGEVGVLKGAQRAGSVPVFTDEKALDAFYAATARNDNEGTEELFNAGRLLMVDVGTKVRVLASSWSTTEIRILEGEFSGRRGFVSGQCVAPAGNSTGQSTKGVGTPHYVSKEESRKLSEEQKRPAQYSAEAQSRIKEGGEEWDKANKAINEFLGITPAPAPTPKPKQERRSSKHETAPAGEQIYPSQPVER